jgi:hypothetical protein
MSKSPVALDANLARLSEIVEISEWIDWMKHMLPPANLELPNEETSVLFAARALRFADRVRPLCRHLPSALNAQLIEAAILHQWWKRRLLLGRKARQYHPPESGTLRLIDALPGNETTNGTTEIYGADGFNYRVKGRSNEHETSLATEVLCSALARLVGLDAPVCVVVHTGRVRSGPGEPHHAREDTLLLGLRFPPSTSKQKEIALRYMIRNFMFEILTLNIRPDPTVRPALEVPDYSHCLLNSDWVKFLHSKYDHPVAPSWITARVCRFAQLEPCIYRIEHLDMSKLWELIFHIPPSWYGGRRSHITGVLEKISGRARDLRRIVWNLIKIGYFPNIDYPRAAPKPSKPEDHYALVQYA